MNPDEMDWIAKLDYFDDFLAANFTEPEWKQVKAGKFEADYLYFETEGEEPQKLRIEMDCVTMKPKISKRR